MSITKLKLVAFVCALAWTQAATVAAQDRNVARGPDKDKRKSAEKDPILVLAQRVKFPGISDPKTTLEDALKMLQSRYGMTYEIQVRAFAREGLKEPDQVLVAEFELLPMEDTLESVLKRILARVPTESGPTFLVRGHNIEITTNAAAQAEIWGPDYRGLHLPLVNILAKKMPLSEALDQLSSQITGNIVCTAPEDKAATTVTARLANVPVDTAVRVLAMQAGLTVVHRDNVLMLVTAKQEAALMKSLKAELPEPGLLMDSSPLRRGTLQPTLPRELDN